MEEFEKESGRVSEAFTTIIRHDRQIEGVRQMSAQTHQADGSKVSYRSTSAHCFLIWLPYS